MRVLWLTNKLLPAIANAAGITSDLVNEGWISGVFSQLINSNNINLIVLCGYNGCNLCGKNSSFEWVLYEETSKNEYIYSKNQELFFKKILAKSRPDIIHIWGSEYPHSLAMLYAAKTLGLGNKIVVWLQGLISACSLPYYYYAGLPDEAVNIKTLYDRVMRTDMKSQNIRFSIRGKYEIELLEKTTHCIGRTAWDQCYVYSVNPRMNYHHCNETLRDCFYSGFWHYESCSKHSIFFSQASYPLKGFHILLRAFPDILKKYPDTHIYVSGYDIMGFSSLRNFLKLKGYGKYLRRIVLNEKLGSHITFTGRLSAEQMKEQYLKSNVFVSCSSLENSSNSIGEAMLLGVPTIVSEVGGTGSIIDYLSETHSFSNLDYKELAEMVIDVFEQEESISIQARRAREHALSTHNRDANISNLISIYETIKNG